MIFLKKFFFWFVSFLIFFLIILVSPILKIRLYLLDTSRIGHLFDEILRYITGNNKKHFDIFISYYPVCNEFLIEQIGKKVKIVTNLKAEILIRTYFIFKKLNFSYFFFKMDNIKIYNVWKNIHKKTKLIKFDNLKIKKILKFNNIKIKKKSVCINIRNDIYLKKIFPKKNFKYHDYRNSNIQNYKKSILFLLKKGYQVFRMGDHLSNDLRIRHKNYYDYSSFKSQNSQLDLYLVSKCNFVICNNTGWEVIASYFNKDILMTDAVSMGITHFGYPYNIIFKHLIKNGKKISLSEIIYKQFHFILKTDEFRKRKLKLKENTKNEILELVSEYLNGSLKRKSKNDFILENNVKTKIKESIKSSNNNFYKKNLLLNNQNIYWNFGIKYLRRFN